MLGREWEVVLIELFVIESKHPRSCTYISSCEKPAIVRTQALYLTVGETYTDAFCVEHLEKFKEKHLMRGGIVPGPVNGLIG